MVKAGYKQTEVGEIPEDWMMSRLGQVCTKITDGTHDTPRPTQNGTPYLTAIHVKPNQINFDDCYYLPDDIHSEIYKRCNPEKGDVLMVNIGAGVATTALVTVNYEFSLKNVALLKPNNDRITGSFLNQYQLFQKDRIVTSLLSGGAQPFLALGQISKINLAHPFCTNEQKAIANALSDVDGLIGALEKQVAKKRDIKTATMQQLLTGKKRLPGFGEGKGYKQTELGQIPEDWKVKSLHEVALVSGGKRLPKGKELLVLPTQHPYIRVADMHMGGVSLEDIKYVPNEVASYISRYKISKKDLFISVAGTLGVVGSIPDVLDQANLTENANRISDIKIDKGFLLNILMGKKIQDEIETQSTVGAQPKLALGRIQNFQIPIPKERGEQKAIADILDAIDNEQVVLTAKLSKTKIIKQGMMQELLTGRTRLV